MPHIILYSWTVYRGPPEELLVFDLSDLIAHLHAGLEVQPQSRAKHVDCILQEAIIDTVGLDAFFSQFKRVLRATHETLNIELYTTTIGFLEIVSAGRTVDVMPHLSQHGLMDLAIATLIDCRLDDGIASSGVRYTDVFSLYR